MTKIAIDARESGTTTGRYVDKLIEHLHALKPDLDFIILTKKHRLEFYRRIAPNFTAIETPYGEFGFGEQIGFKQQLESLNLDLVHFAIVQQPVWYRGTVVTTMHDLTTTRFSNPSKNRLVFMLKQRVYKWVNKKVARKSAIIITASNYVKEDIVRFTGVDPNKIIVTYEAADFITDAPEPVAKLVDKPFIMYVGRPQSHKNLRRLIDAFVILQHTKPDLWLALAGKRDALYEAHEHYVHTHSIKHILFTGYISEGQLRWLYEHCVAYVFPSLSEGFGLPGLEAMLHGAPVVSSNATCLPEIYGDAALYFDPTDAQAMAKAISDVLTDTHLRTKLIVAGKKHVKKYSWKRMANQTLQLYKDVLSEK